MILNPKVQTVTAFAPATCANVAVGFDILGFACEHLGDTVTLTVRHDQRIVIDAIDSKDTLPFDETKNTASIVVKEMVESLQLGVGFTLQIKKGIPMSSGLGGSAASAAAAAVACNAFLTTPLSKKELVSYALFGEAAASGQAHADNLAPCIYGGVTLVHSLEPLNIIALPPPEIFCVLVYPHLKINTKDARKLLKEHVPLSDCVKQMGQLAGFISALYAKDTSLLQRSLTDFLVEPQRAQLIPAFYAIKEAAMKQGAFAMSFSGSGPTLFAFVEKEHEASRVGEAMCTRLQQENIKADYWVSKVGVSGARII